MRITPRGRFRLAMLLVLTLLVVHPDVAAASVSAHTANHSTAAPRFDGETLYRGLAFAQGPVAALFPEFASLPPPSAEAIAIVDRIVTRIRSIEPSFFPRFASAIQKVTASVSAPPSTTRARSPNRPSSKSSAQVIKQSRPARTAFSYRSSSSSRRRGSSRSLRS